jgi:hypothetical protein
LGVGVENQPAATSGRTELSAQEELSVWNHLNYETVWSYSLWGKN